MSAAYRAVGWNAFKKRYDLVLVLGIVLFLVVFVASGAILFPKMTFEILLIRAFAVAAFGLLHLILVIGPMARFDRMWLPLLYNRRHLGVSMFLLALIHSVLAVLTYHAAGEVNPILSILRVGNGALSESGFRAWAVPCAGGCSARAGVPADRGGGRALRSTETSKSFPVCS